MEILVSLMMRVDDERIGSALHSSAGAGLRCTLRGRLIRLAGMHRRTQLLDAVITALGDTDAKVRLEAIIAVDSFPVDSGPSRKPSSILSLVSCSMTTTLPCETRP